MAMTIRRMLSVQVANVLTYRMEMVLWAISGALPLILAGLWYEAARLNPGSFGMTSDEYVRYFFATFTVRQLTLVWVVWEFEHHLVKGTLSHQLLMPIDPVWRYVTEHLAERLVRLPIIAVLGVVFFLLFPEGLTNWQPTLAALLVGAMAIVCTFILRFIVQYAFGMLAFWTERAHAVEQLWYLPYIYVSGLIVPLSDMPQAMQTAVLWTPFPYLIGWPAEILIGRRTDIAHGLMVMAIWAVIFLVIQQTLWRAGLRKYSAMGA